MFGPHAKCKSHIINEIDLGPWTDDELDYLDRIGQITISLDEPVTQTNKTDEEILEWSEEIDLLDLETDQYLED